jgi:hypothetical protein
MSLRGGHWIGRIPAVPVAVLFWITAVLGVRMADHFQVGFPLCGLRLLTGLPCPTCGTTRALLASSKLEFGKAFAFNPLVILGSAALWAWFVLWAIDRGLGSNWTGAIGKRLRHRHWLGVLVLAAVANWIYLIFCLP